MCRSATYVVDVRSLHCHDDIEKDEFGIWNYSGSHPQPFKVRENDDDLRVEKCCPGVSGMNVVLLRRIYYTHPSNAKFKTVQVQFYPSFGMPCDPFCSYSNGA